MEDIDVECRFCLSSDTDTSKIIRPCSCRGTCAFVHAHCLTKWVDTSGNRSCMACNVEFKGEYVMKSILSWRIPSTPKFKRCFISIIVFFVLLSFLIQSHILHRESTNDLFGHCFLVLLEVLSTYGLVYYAVGGIMEFRIFNETFVALQEHNVEDVV